MDGASMTELQKSALDIAVGVTMGIGLLSCFVGYRVSKLVVALMAFVLGGVLTVAAAEVGLRAQDQTGVLIAGLAGGLVVAALAVVLFYVGIFLAGAAGAGGLVLGGYVLFHVTPNWAVIGIAGGIGGLLALLLQKLLIILSTAVVGAAEVAFGALYFLGLGRRLRALQIARDRASLRRVLSEVRGGGFYIAVAGAIVLAIVGLIVQFRRASRAAGLVAAPPDAG